MVRLTWDYAPGEGDLIKITYRSQSGNGRWGLFEMTAIYLAWLNGEHAVSLRPKSGTTHVPHKDITNVELVMDAENVREKYRGGARDALLPVKVPRRIESLKFDKETETFSVVKR